jgi:radical S-adenosyl methionine domain-containing protein 2
LDRRELSFSQGKKIVDKLSEAGVKKLSWAGGEPLIWPGMVKLVEYTHSLGIMTMLITNGSLLNDKLLKRLENSLDWLNLPLDGASEHMNRLMTRDEGHFDRVIDILEKLKDSKISLKINTVISKINLGDVVNIVPIIQKYGVKRWKLFQFYPVRGMAVAYKDRFEVSTLEFERLRGQVEPLFSSGSCMVVFENNKELERSYFAIAPDGSVYVSYKQKDFFLGNLLTQSVEDIWKNKLLDKKKYWQRAKWIL